MKPDDIRFYIGYSGWTEYQLDEELQEFSWLVAEPTISDLFKKPISEMWKLSVAELGKDYELWANYPSDPTLN
jgi:putative transcriptional regulator